MNAGFAGSLEDALGAAWDALCRGAADRRSAFHTPVAATRGLDDQPQARTVVLRAADSSARTLRFHTDRRSPKYAELERDARIQLLFYDAAAKLQIRAPGRAVLHTAGDLADRAWAQSRPFSRACYAQHAAPGSSTGSPLAAPVQEDPEDGRSVFVAVEVRLNALEWLWLDHAGHRRARHGWNDAGESIVATWLAP